jgi:pilus assembly protein Flp/PilA
MTVLRRFARDLWHDEEAATALEYGLIAAAIAGVIITVVYMLGGRISNKMNTVATHL